MEKKDAMDLSVKQTEDNDTVDLSMKQSKDSEVMDLSMEPSKSSSNKNTAEEKLSPTPVSIDTIVKPATSEPSTSVNIADNVQQCCKLLLNKNIAEPDLYKDIETFASSEYTTPDFTDDPSKCSICIDYDWNVASKYHYRLTIHGSEDHKCEVCSETFHCRFYLSEHKVLNHYQKFYERCECSIIPDF